MPSFDYSSRDYNTIKADLLARAGRIAPEWTDRDQADFGMVLVDLWSQMGDVLHYYVDRAAGEVFLPTATQRESVLAYARLFDYDPASRTGARGTVVLNNSGTAVSLPQYTRFVARYDGATYQLYSREAITLSANSSTTVSVSEGVIVSSPAETLTNSSTGVEAQRYRLANLNAVKDSVVITVYEDGVTPTNYRRVVRLTDAVPGERVFILNTTPLGYLEVLFGTASRGFVPPANSIITATYAYSSGSLGNLPANSVTAFRESTPENVTIVSSSALSGGREAESIESMRNTVPSIIASQNRAVTLNDYTNLALSVDGVQKAAVQYTPNPAGGASAGNASVTVYAQTDRSNDYLTTTDTSQTVDAVTQDSIVSTLTPRSMLGVDVTAASTITWKPIDVVVTVNVLSSYVALYVQRDVEAVIDSIFDFNNVRFGQTISLGRLYRGIMGVRGVDYANITVLDHYDASPQSTQTTITVGDYELPKKGTVNVTVVGGITST
jgi:predicted phage baseplate assembly protein